MESNGEFINPGCGRCVVLTKHEEHYLIRILREHYPYCVCSELGADGNWHWGDYYQDLFDAVDAYRGRCSL
jgi:hypothetical protein